MRDHNSWLGGRKVIWPLHRFAGLVALACFLSFLAGRFTATAPHQTQEHQNSVAGEQDYFVLGASSWPLTADGELELDVRLTHFSMDIGVAHLTETAHFLEHTEGMFVISVEANPFVYTYIKHTSSPLNSLEYCLFDSESATQRCSASKRGRFKLWHENQHRALLLNAAAGPREEGFVNLHLGHGFNDPHDGEERHRFAASDVSSVLGWEKQERVSREGGRTARVPFLPMKRLLSLVPARLAWDLLKVDAQGADGAAVISTGAFVRRFRCVIAEFETNKYVATEEYPETAESFLVENGFAKVNKNFFVNLRFVEDFRAKNYFCEVGDMGGKADDERHSLILAALKT